ncbi:MAG TPA: class I SAM-dependent methyltransferase [Acidobacteriaceae bacterium]|nr:class I SAM-dependent methyltransferase [Acidobacteriaceae bacterium]
MKSTERFSTRVEAYREHRPRYPKEVVELLRRECGLTAEWVVADVAAGTGLLAEIFLDNGNRVIAVEPNGPMRAACAELEAQYPRLECVDGTAEATGLADGVADLVTVGQAMHWFDLEKTRAEFMRVLKPGGWCAVVYNHRRMGGDGFHDGYERLLVEYGGDYRAVQSKHMTEDKLEGFFAPGEMRSVVLPNHQELTLEGLQGRVLSSSYMPQTGDGKYPAMMDAIGDLFARYVKDGVVRMEYETAVGFGGLW